MLGGALLYGSAMIWQVAMVYGRIGDLETATGRTDTFIAGRIQSNEKRWDQVAQLRDQVIRVEEQSKLILETVRRLENRERR